MKCYYPWKNGGKKVNFGISQSFDLILEVFSNPEDSAEFKFEEGSENAKNTLKFSPKTVKCCPLSLKSMSCLFG